MSRRIPPLNPLRMFEVAARTKNLTIAARELHISQSAVSRQIGVLENYLGIKLFRRGRHGVTLTQAGENFANQIIPAFDAIANATVNLNKTKNSGTLRVRTYTTFAAKWLIPHLPEFKKLHPDIDVRIMTAVPDVDFDRDNVDLAIQFGDGKWPHVKSDLLFSDEIEPVCSPNFLKNIKTRNRPNGLLGTTLLISQFRRSDWGDWLSMSSLNNEAMHAEKMSFSSSLLTWQAALDGLGIAIGQTRLLKSELESKQLVRPFSMPARRSKGHYLLRPSSQRDNKKISAFRDWIIHAFKNEESC